MHRDFSPSNPNLKIREQENGKSANSIGFNISIGANPGVYPSGERS